MFDDARGVVSNVVRFILSIQARCDVNGVARKSIRDAWAVQAVNVNKIRFPRTFGQRFARTFDEKVKLLYPSAADDESEKLRPKFEDLPSSWSVIVRAFSLRFSPVSKHQTIKLNKFQYHLVSLDFQKQRDRAVFSLLNSSVTGYLLEDVAKATFPSVFFVWDQSLTSDAKSLRFVSSV